ncbi:hypothetical protein GWI33_009657, partial [Rhynchophorus ferrugineus]
MAFCACAFAIISVLVTIVGLIIFKLKAKQSVPVLDPEEYWGPGEKPNQNDLTIKDFKIQISQQ